jgi:hypothetical protein
MHYLLVHQIQQYPSTQDAWIDTWRGVRRRCSAETRWLHSFLDTSHGKLYCEWEASDLESIMACLDAESLAMAPLEYHSEIVYFDPAWLDEA